MELNITVPGEPIGKRVDQRVVGKRAIPYLKKKTRDYIELVAEHARHAVEAQGWIVGDGQTPLYIDIEAYFPVRQSWSKKRVLEALEGRYHTSTPDIDNIQKGIYDGLVGPKIPGQARTHEAIVMMDDGQVAMCRIRKLYCPLGEERVSIKVVELAR